MSGGASGRLGRSDLVVSRLALGSWKTFEHLTRDEGLAVMQAARRLGVTFLDDARYNDDTGSAPIPTGYSEVLFGELFRAARWPRAIGLDVLLDQATEPAKDDRLRRTLRDLPVPLAVSYIDSAALVLVNDEQQAFLDDFVPPADRALANLATDQFDTVRWTYPGHALAEGGYLNGFARALAAAVGIDSPASSTLTRELLGWQPTQPGLIDDLDEGHYFHNPSV